MNDEYCEVNEESLFCSLVGSSDPSCEFSCTCRTVISRFLPTFCYILYILVENFLSQQTVNPKTDGGSFLVNRLKKSSYRVYQLSKMF